MWLCSSKCCLTVPPSNDAVSTAESAEMLTELKPAVIDHHPDYPLATDYESPRPTKGHDRESPPPTKGHFQSPGGFPLSPEERARENTKLQCMVRAFAKRAMLDVPISVITDEGVLRPAVYKMDKVLSKISVKGTDSDSVDTRHSIQLERIQDIYCLEDGNRGLFPEAVQPQQQKLVDEYITRLLIVLYTNEDEASHRLLMLESDSEERDRCLTCIRILKLYAIDTMSSSNAPRDEAATITSTSTTTGSC